MEGGIIDYEMYQGLYIIFTWTVFLVPAVNDDLEMLLEDWNNIPPLLQATRLNIMNNPGTIILYTINYPHHQEVRQ